MVLALILPVDSSVSPTFSETTASADVSRPLSMVTATTNDCPAGMTMLALNVSDLRAPLELEMSVPSAESEM